MVGDIEKHFFVSDSQENFNRREIFSIFDSDRLTGNHRKTPVNYGL